MIVKENLRTSLSMRECVFLQMALVKVIVVTVTVVLVLLSLVEEGNLKNYNFHRDNSMNCVKVQSC